MISYSYRLLKFIVDSGQDKTNENVTRTGATMSRFKNLIVIIIDMLSRIDLNGLLVKLNRYNYASYSFRYGVIYNLYSNTLFINIYILLLLNDNNT